MNVYWLISVYLAEMHESLWQSAIAGGLFPLKDWLYAYPEWDCGNLSSRYVLNYGGYKFDWIYVIKSHPIADYCMSIPGKKYRIKPTVNDWYELHLYDFELCIREITQLLTGPAGSISGADPYKSDSDPEIPFAEMSLTPVDKRVFFTFPPPEQPGKKRAKIIEELKDMGYSEREIVDFHMLSHLPSNYISMEDFQKRSEKALTRSMMVDEELSLAKERNSSMLGPRDAMYEHTQKFEGLSQMTVVVGADDFLQTAKELGERLFNLRRGEFEERVANVNDMKRKREAEKERLEFAGEVRRRLPTEVEREDPREPGTVDVVDHPTEESAVDVVCTEEMPSQEEIEQGNADRVCEMLADAMPMPEEVVEIE